MTEASHRRWRLWRLGQHWRLGQLWRLRQLRRSAPALLLASTLIAPSLISLAPQRIEDPRVSRDLPPGSRLTLVELRDGTRLLAERVSIAPSGDLRIERPSGALEVSPSSLATPPTERRWVLGSDRLGRDLLARLAHGWRTSLVVSAAATALALLFGVTIGLGAAYLGGFCDRLAMRAVDIAIAIPKLFILLAIVAAHQPGAATLALILACSSWMSIARLTRAAARSLRHAPFVEAARAGGSGHARVLVQHVLPHLRETLVHLALMQLSSVVLLEAALSFVGAGLPPPTPTLGGLLADAALAGAPTWWTVVFPGVAIACASLACHGLARSLRRTASACEVAY